MTAHSVGILSDIGVARILSVGCTFLPEKLDDLFIVVALKTHAKTA